MSSNMVVIQSSDDVKFTLEIKAAERSVLLRGLLEGYSNDKEIPIPEIKGEILKRCVEYLNHYKDIEPREIPKPLPSENLLEVVDEWDATFISSFDLDTVFDLINASNYLDLRPLLDLCCARIASIMKGKSAEEIRSIFNLENDLSEDEIKAFEEYEI